MKSRTLNAVHRHSYSERERGQALVFTLLFAAAAGLVGLLLFNNGLLANTKSKLQNTADAAAYSAGVLQARDHNFSAYTNRAMVANQAAVAQLVSMKSYLEDGADTHDRMQGVWLSMLALIPSSKPHWNFEKSNPIESVYSVFEKVAPRAVQALDGLIAMFEKAQTVHHNTTLTEMVLVADDVVTANDPLANVTKGSVMGLSFVRGQKWHASTKSHVANDASKNADRFADVVVSRNTTDLFTRNRASIPVPFLSPGGSWLSDVSACKVIPNYAFSSTMFLFAHSGGTQLSADKKRWLGMDAALGGGFASCTYWVPCPIFLGPCLTISLPLVDTIGNTSWIPGGSGGALAGKASKGGGYDSLNGYKNNPVETKLYGGAAIIPTGIFRYNVKGPGATLDSKGGLQDTYRDMADPTKVAKTQAPEDNGGAFPILVEVERKSASVRTSSKILPNSTLIKLDDKMKSDTMRSLAAAHAYFYRPKTDSAVFTHTGWRRSDNKTEVENLFSPYWQARLMETDDAARTLSWVQK